MPNSANIQISTFRKTEELRRARRKFTFVRYFVKSRAFGLGRIGYIMQLIEERDKKLLVREEVTGQEQYSMSVRPMASFTATAYNALNYERNYCFAFTSILLRKRAVLLIEVY